MEASNQIPNNKTQKNFINGKWQCKNLAFLVEFMRTAGLSVPKLAELTGYTRQCIVFWLNSDNASLKKLEAVFKKIGYKLEYELVKEQEQCRTYIRLASPSNKNSLNNNTCERLMFLVTAMAKYNITIMDITKQTGLRRSTVAHWFDVDDIMIENIHLVARTFGLTVNMRITPLEENEA